MLRRSEKEQDIWHYRIHIETKREMARHLARMKDSRWTKRRAQWQPRKGKRSRGRPSRRWQDDIAKKEGTIWNRNNRQKTMEGIDGGLHPEVDGQSLGEKDGISTRVTKRRKTSTLMFTGDINLTENYIVTDFDLSEMYGQCFFSLLAPLIQSSILVILKSEIASSKWFF